MIQAIVISNPKVPVFEARVHIVDVPSLQFQQLALVLVQVLFTASTYAYPFQQPVQGYSL